MTKTLGYGTILEYYTGSAYAAIGQVKDITGPGITRDIVDVTTQDSTDSYKEFLAALADPGEVTFTVEFDPDDSSHDQTSGLLSLLENTSSTNFNLITPVSATTGYWGFAFAGLVTGFELKSPVEGSIQADVTIKVTSKPTLSDITPA